MPLADCGPCAYRAPPWLPGGHAQTIWSLAIKGPLPAYRRERWDSPDGDFIDVDCLPPRPGAPLVVLFHGLEGSSASHYARALMHALAHHGWNGAVPHFRGCSGAPNRLLRAYHSGDADEIHWILTRFRERYPDVPRYAAGVSLGGNALLVWAGSRGAQAAELVRAVAAVSAPLDLAAAGHQIGRGFNRAVYTRHFLASLLPRIRDKGRRHPGGFDLARALCARTLKDFDDAYTAPVHGFRDAEDYWRRAASKPWLKHICLPSLVLNARNDPFMPATALPQPTDVAPSVRLEQPEQGGHVGFITGRYPGRLDWLPRRLLQFFDSAAAGPELSPVRNATPSIIVT